MRNKFILGVLLVLAVFLSVWVTPKTPLIGPAVSWINPALVATNGNLMPNPRNQFFTSNGVVLSSGGVCTYAAGTTTPASTFSDQTLATPNANPIPLDTGGRLQNNVYLNAISYKFALLDSTNTALAQSFGCGALGVSFTSVWTADTIPGATGTDASTLSSGNLAYARMPAGSGTWTATPTITGPVAISSGSGSAFTVVGGATFGAGALVVDATGIITSSVQPRVSVFNSGVQSVGSGSNVALTFDSEDYDVGNMHSTSANTSRMTVPSGAGGVYAMCAATTFAANNTGARELFFRKNGSTALNGQPRLNSPSAGSQENLTLCRQATLSAGDYIEVMVLQSSGGNLNVGDSSAPTESAAQMVRLW